MNNRFRKRLNAVIPGGAHTYSRGDDQYPENAPPILTKGKGCYVWDPSGRRYLDYGMALRAVTIGYAYEPVVKAATDEIRKGNNLTRASVTELEAAERLARLFPSQPMVKFAKNGSTVTTAAIKIARAYTGRTYVAFPKEHPFFSYDDWFIGVTPMDRGIPQENKSLSLRFNYNDLGSLEQLFLQHPGEIACVIMEPATSESPCGDDHPMQSTKPCNRAAVSHRNFLQQVRDLCRKNGALFILDEMITGFRWDLKGAQHYFDVEPDLSTFGKGMANGFSVAALIGKKEIMKIGGIDEPGAERVFLISTTHGAEMAGLGALKKVIDLYKKLGVVDHLWDYGTRLMNGMNDLSKEFGIAERFCFDGFPCSPVYMTKDAGGEVSLEFRTLFAQELLRNRILMPWVALSYAHGDRELEMTLEAGRKALKVYAQALNGDIRKYLKGRSVQPVFRKFN